MPSTRRSARQQTPTSRQARPAARDERVYVGQRSGGRWDEDLEPGQVADVVERELDSDDWVEPKSPRNVRIAMGIGAVAAIVLIFASLGGGSHGLQAMAAPLPRALELGSTRPVFEPPVPVEAPAAEVAPVEAAAAEPAPEAKSTERVPTARRTGEATKPRPATKPALPTARREPKKDKPTSELGALIAGEGDGADEGGEEEEVIPEPIVLAGDHRAYITSRPAGATVTVEGRYVGRTPVAVVWTGKERKEADIALAGHDSTTLVLTPKSAGRTLSVVLDEAAEEAAPEPPKKGVLEGAFDGF